MGWNGTGGVRGLGQRSEGGFGKLQSGGEGDPILSQGLLISNLRNGVPCENFKPGRQDLFAFCKEHWVWPEERLEHGRACTVWTGLHLEGRLLAPENFAKRFPES